MGVCNCEGRSKPGEETSNLDNQSNVRISKKKKQETEKGNKKKKRINLSLQIQKTKFEEEYLNAPKKKYLNKKKKVNDFNSEKQNQRKINNFTKDNKIEKVSNNNIFKNKTISIINQDEIIKSSNNNISNINPDNNTKDSIKCKNCYCNDNCSAIIKKVNMSENPTRNQNQYSIKNSGFEGTTNISNNNETSNQLLMGDNELQISNLLNKENKKEINFNFQLIEMHLNNGEKAGCGAYYFNIFCTFTSSNGDTFLVYPVKNKFQKYIRVYYLNLDNNKKEILFEKFDDLDSSKTIKENRHIPTQCRHFKIEKDDFLIIGFRDSYIYIYKFENNIFKEIKYFPIGGAPINGVCLFKNKYTNEINIITSQIDTFKIKIADLNEKNKGIIKNIVVENNIFFLDTFSKDNQNYFIIGFLNEVIIALELQLYDKMPLNVKHYKNIERQNNYKNIKGHECAIIYKSKENENNIKLIDSDVEGKLINIFDFESTALLLVLDLKICKPLGLDIWDSNHIIVSCFQDENNDSIKIIKVNLEKENYNKNYIDLKQNEIGEEAKIVCHLNGHEDGVLSCLKMKNKLNEEFLISIGGDGILKQWQNKLSKVSLSFALYNNQSDY